MNKIPVILEYPDQISSVCSFWRSRGVLSELAKEGHIGLIEGQWDDNWTTIRSCDIAFFQRPMNKDCLNQIMKCKDLGLKIWMDFDDTFEIPPSHEVYDLWTKIFDEKVFFKMLMLADVVTVTTENLKNFYLKYSNDVVVIPNAINDKFLKFRRPSNNKVVLIRAGKHHLPDIWEYKNEIIQVMNNHPDWKLVVLGCEIKFLSNKIKNYEYGGDFDIHQYFGYILTTQPSIFIVPLLDNELNRGKSNISWQEATLCGAVSLVPDYWKLKKYSGTYKDKKTFKQYFEELVFNKELRIGLYNNSLSKVKKDFLLSKVNKQRLQIIKNLMK